MGPPDPPSTHAHNEQEELCGEKLETSLGAPSGDGLWRSTDSGVTWSSGATQARLLSPVTRVSLAAFMSALTDVELFTAMGREITSFDCISSTP